MKKLAQLVLAATLGMSAGYASADAISDAAMSDVRTAKAKARDEYRNPQQTLRFFGLQPDMTVVEISPGGGWYADIITKVVKDNGKYVAAHFFVDESTGDYFKNAVMKFESQMKPGMKYEGAELTAFDPIKALDITEAGSADMVLTFRNVHNWYMRHGDEGIDNAFGAFFKALKPGGVLGVVEHELPESADDEAMKKSGYMKRSYVIAAAEKAGFKLAESSDVNANPMDNANHPKGVWTLPPRLALDDQDREKYLAIGESNRMTLKFVKP
ncbi:methyltransferase [Alteromonas sp. KC3]|uniref:class I SAM-dependent methyltransferase n=1 Tax=unclassified Alteromonas TaxID=2614992 RepID=UPI001922100A|nr:MULTISPECIES: class I SAM-dependent methyltransferase [unclassified Alteromonas]BCO20955.1 methyltransferase [Alteromonas sp. KC3]BCO24925.1 methyltransferase [Alteromonas sp. KC14]